MDSSGSSTQSHRRLFFIKSLQSQSFPRTAREDTAFAAAESSEDSPLLAYTSLRDLMPPSRGRNFRSKSFEAQSAQEIHITNFLVKKAALAYLQPIPMPGRSESSIWHRVWEGVSPPVNACIKAVGRLCSSD
jgi:hypothetical protein